MGKSEGRKRLLIVEPYYGGSHRLFIDGLRDHLDVDAVLLSLPPWKWKMRMQLSAPWFAECVRKMERKERRFDAVLCSTFVDVAVLRSLLMQIPDWNRFCRFCTYYHENQFVYPGRKPDPSMYQFAAINYMTAVVSDTIAFNSKFNKRSFLEGGLQYVKKSSDMHLDSVHELVCEKSHVLYPGQDYADIDRCFSIERGPVPVILWNHRWEHDKNPEEFFETLMALKQKSVPFKLMVLGESFRAQPECFRKAQHCLADELLHFGYVESREQYCRLLCGADIVVSTSYHEFFGISVLEAVRAGCYPLLPARLSYPELFPEKYLYGEGGLETKLEELLMAGGRLSPAISKTLTSPYDWNELKERYMHWLFSQP